MAGWNRILRSIATLAISGAGAVGLGGCALYQNVAIESQPSGAEIFLDGDVVGTTPMRMRVGRGADHSIYLKKEGYRPRLVVLELHPTDDAIDYLTPADVRVGLSPLPDSGDRDVTIQIEP